MAGLGLSLEVIGLENVLDKLGKDTVESPLKDGIKRLALKLEGLVTKATPVDFGILKDSITHEVQPLWAKVGTNIEYAPFVEYGTSKMQARHVEGGAVGWGRGAGPYLKQAAGRVYGLGMFHYGLEQLQEKIDEDMKELAKDIEIRFEKI